MTHEPDWWKRTTVYQIYPRSFADSNGDGIGDLPGILGRLDYLHALGVETLWLSPFFTSPQADFGYDVSDHYGIAPEYGTHDDCRRLIDEVHARGMKIVFDMVLNHTSNQHPWFQESRASRDSPRRDHYLWRPGRGKNGENPPNNWRSMLGPSGWHRDPGTGDWYWASFLPFQPDLNYRNPEVKHAMLDVVRHWLREGVDGLRLDIFNAIYKDASFADNPLSLRPVPSEDNPHGFFQRYERTLDHPDTLAFARELRRVVDDAPGPPRFVVGEVFGDAETLRRYCGEPDDPGLHLVFLFQSMKTRFQGRAVRALLEELEEAFPAPYVPTYVFGNHDRPRFIGKHGDDPTKAKLFATLQLTARGVPFVYYGEEIGLGHHEIPLAQGLDPIAARFGFVPQWAARALTKVGILLNRDEARLPMSWHAGDNAGFSHAAAIPWLPVHPRHREVNVEAQASDPSSLLHCYRDLLRLRRRTRALHAGSLELLDAVPRDVVGYRRSYGDTGETADVFLNFGSSSRRLPAARRPGARLWSNLRCETRPAPNVLELAPREGVVVLSPRGPRRGVARRGVVRGAAHALRVTPTRREKNAPGIDLAGSRDMRRAYATLLCGGDGYVPGAEALGKSLQATGTSADRVALVTADVTPAGRALLRAQGWSLRDVSPLENPNPSRAQLLPRFHDVFTKLRAWELLDYERVVFLDADTLVLQNVDELFERPEFAAAPDFFLPDRFNSGVMVLEPSAARLAEMVATLATAESYDGGDQGFLNTYFAGWYAMPVGHRLPIGYNMAHFIYRFLHGHPSTRERLEHEVKILHFLVQKPWRARSTLTGASELWWSTFFDARPELARPWRSGLHALEDWTFDHLAGAVVG